MKTITRTFLLALCLLLTLAPLSLAEEYTNVTIRLAQQYGLQYAPVYVMQNLGLLEKHLPGITTEWSALGGGSAMNEALISGRLDVAFMGIPPMVIAWDKGVDYRIAAGICVPPAELMVRDASVQSLADIGTDARIAVPSIGSIQHIMLALAAERVLGDSHALDNNIIAMANPDAYTSLISGTDITGHFASMPYIDLESENGMHSILSGKEAYESQASIICVAAKRLYEQTAVYQGLLAALDEAIALINAKDENAIRIVAETEKISEEDALRYLTWPGTIYSTELYGVMGLAEFMFANEYVENELTTLDDIIWPGVVEAK